MFRSGRKELIRAYERELAALRAERKDLLDRIMLLADRPPPWLQAAPVEEVAAPYEDYEQPDLVVPIFPDL